MKTIKTHILIIAILWNCNSAFGQVDSVSNTLKNDIFFVELLQAHRTYKDVSYYNAKKLVDNYGKKSLGFSNAMILHEVVVEGGLLGE